MEEETSKKVGIARITAPLLKKLFNFPADVSSIHYNYEADTYDFVLKGENMPRVFEGGVMPVIGEVHLKEDGAICLQWKNKEYNLLKQSNITTTKNMEAINND